MGDIFISYAREDSDRIVPFVRHFKAQGWSVWSDAGIAHGARFAKEIDKALAASKCVVVLWTRASVESDWVQNEAAEGKDRKVLVPVMLDEVKPPLEFRGIEAAELWNWDGQSPHPELDALLSSVARIINQPIAQPLPPLTRWQRLLAWLRRYRRTLVVASVALLAMAVMWLVFRGTPYGNLKKLQGDGQIISESRDKGYRDFYVKVIDGQGGPVPGAKVLWLTPYCGNRGYVGQTNGEGVTSATNMCSPMTRGPQQQVAVLVDRGTRVGFWNESREVRQLGRPVTFSFEYRD